VVAKLLRFVEVLVLSLENPKGNPIHGLVESHVGAVNQAVAVLFVKLGGEARDGCGFSVERAAISAYKFG
jgi:hypothetical protein